MLRARSGQPAALVISAIGGAAGIGKTALAVHWTHQVAGQFPDGQLYVNLRGFHHTGKPMHPNEATRYLLDALGVPAQRIPASLDGQAALYRSLVWGKRMLILLDNARDVGQVRPLLPGSAGCLVLVTSRSQLSGLIAIEGACALALDVLTEAEARELLALSRLLCLVGAWAQRYLPAGWPTRRLRGPVFGLVPSGVGCHRPGCPSGA